MAAGGDDDKESKTEVATEQKRAKAIEEGNVPVVRDTSSLASVLALLAYGVFLLPAVLQLIFPGILVFWAQADEIAFSAAGDVLAILNHLALVVFFVLGPFLLLVVSMTVGLTYLQNPPRFYPKRLVPKLENLSLSKGMRRLFSRSALLEFGKSIFKIAAVSAVVWFVARAHFSQMLATSRVESAALPQAYMAVIGRLVGYVALTLAVFHIAEMFLSRLKWARELRMSRQELKEEFRHTEGDPMVRARLRALAQSRARNRMMAAVPQATVILANPTHFAIALRYRREEGGAPLVVAKGLDHLALRIRSVGQDHNVPVIENRSLARNLYYEVEVGEMIPSNFYRAVAEIIVVVNAARQRMQQQT